MSVQVETSGPVTTVLLRRPAVRNAVDPATARALYEAFVAFDRDDASRVAVLAGEGGHFCAGFDLHALAAGTAEGWLESLHFGTATEPPLGPMGPTRLQLGKPVIAAIAGAAVAGGMELALWCDLRVMEDDAYLGIYCRRWGVPLIDGGTVRLPRLIGQGRALDLILTGRKVPARECLEIGLCERLVPSGTSRQAAEELAAEIASFPQDCLRRDRASAFGQQGLGLEAALQQEFTAGVGAVREEGLAGAGRFASGKGRGGDFEETREECG